MISLINTKECTILLEQKATKREVNVHFFVQYFQKNEYKDISKHHLLSPS
jgi:hypothetical protein